MSLAKNSLVALALKTVGALLVQPHVRRPADLHDRPVPVLHLQHLQHLQHLPQALQLHLSPNPNHNRLPKQRRAHRPLLRQQLQLRAE